MTDHAAASAADRDRDGHAAGDAADPDRPDGGASAPTPKLLMFGAADAPNCDGDGCVVPFAVNTNLNTNMEGNPK